MFHASTQKKHWTFSTEDPEILDKIRKDVNEEYVNHFASVFGVSSEEEKADLFLSADEEKVLTAVYEAEMLTLCRRFVPALPPAVQGTAFHYFKRFYLGHSVMNYHPADLFPTCLFLACKVEEYNLSIDEFVKVFERDREWNRELIIRNELLVITAVKFHLTVHNPFRPVKGLLIDMETKRPDLFTTTPPEALHKPIYEFLEKVFFTDVIFFYAPSQIALAAILHAISKKGRAGGNIDSYVAGNLIPSDKLKDVVEAVRAIRHQVRQFKVKHTAEQVAAIEAKCAKCRNPENDPRSSQYRKPMEEDDDEDLENSFG